MKFCPGCETEKDESEFFKCARTSDGLQGYCKQCNRIKKREYRVAHPDKQHAYDARRRQRQSYKDAKRRDYVKHHEARYAGQCDWRKRNPERIKAYNHSPQSKEYQRHRALQRWLNDKDQLLAYMAAYGKRRRNAEGRHTAIEWQELCNRFEGCCGYCGQPKKLTRHHVIPLIMGGSDDISNIAPACQSCNSSISTKILQPSR